MNYKSRYHNTIKLIANLLMLIYLVSMLLVLYFLISIVVFYKIIAKSVHYHMAIINLTFFCIHA